MFSRWRRVLGFGLGIMCLCVIARGVFMYKFLHAHLNLAETTTFTLDVVSGSSFSQVIRGLSRQGVLQHGLDLEVYARLTGLAGQIKAGEYKLAADTSSLQLLDKLVKGEVTNYQLILLEGWTIAEVLTEIQANENIISTINLNGTDKAGVVGIQNNNLEEIFEFSFYPEGMFFPDTYNFTQGTTDREILLRARNLMIDVLAEEWAARDAGLPYETSFEALIMASIVEKETALADERDKIAGVFVRRLQQGMRLQTDPTVIYGLGEAFNGNLTRANLRADTPYNTYTNAGLPPTPIALAGREAINASLHPEQNSYLYFVAKGDGSHYFSSTLAEHNQAVQQYQITNRVEEYRSQP